MRRGNPNGEPQDGGASQAAPSRALASRCPGGQELLLVRVPSPLMLIREGLAHSQPEASLLLCKESDRCVIELCREGPRVCRLCHCKFTGLCCFLGETCPPTPSSTWLKTKPLTLQSCCGTDCFWTSSGIAGWWSEMPYKKNTQPERRHFPKILSLLVLAGHAHLRSSHGSDSSSSCENG